MSRVSSPEPALATCRARAGRAGLQEFGLPYASDPVVSKHIARFLAQSLQNVKASEKLAALVGARPGREVLIPTAVLFNGGVFKAAPIRTRVLDLLASWNGGQPVRELQGFDPDLAVARGAAIYGRHRVTGKGMRIKAGAARSYYIGLETSMPAVPGYKPPLKALVCCPAGDAGRHRTADRRTRVRPCHRPRGGVPVLLLLGAKRRHSRDRSCRTPNVILRTLACSKSRFRALADFPVGQVVPVRINPVITELGILELWMKHTNSDRRWKVEFQVRTE